MSPSESQKTSIVVRVSPLNTAAKPNPIVPQRVAVQRRNRHEWKNVGRPNSTAPMTSQAWKVGEGGCQVGFSERHYDAEEFFKIMHAPPAP
jgi:hypothetical protein